MVAPLKKTQIKSLHTGRLKLFTCCRNKYLIRKYTTVYRYVLGWSTLTRIPFKLFGWPMCLLWQETWWRSFQKRVVRTKLYI